MPQEPKKPNYKIQETEISRKRREKEMRDLQDEGQRDFAQHSKSSDSLRVERSKLSDDDTEGRKKFRTEQDSLNAGYDERSADRTKKLRKRVLDADRFSKGGGS